MTVQKEEESEVVEWRGKEGGKSGALPALAQTTAGVW